MRTGSLFPLASHLLTATIVSSLVVAISNWCQIQRAWLAMIYPVYQTGFLIVPFLASILIGDLIAYRTQRPFRHWRVKPTVLRLVFVIPAGFIGLIVLDLVFYGVLTPITTGRGWELQQLPPLALASLCIWIGFLWVAFQPGAVSNRLLGGAVALGAGVSVLAVALLPLWNNLAFNPVFNTLAVMTFGYGTITGVLRGLQSANGN